MARMSVVGQKAKYSLRVSATFALFQAEEKNFDFMNGLVLPRCGIADRTRSPTAVSVRLV
jgi:hypothetical protein